MKKFYGVFAGMLLVFGLAGVAGAIPMTWTDMIDWKPDKYINHNKSYHYYHDISDDGFGGFGSGDWVTHYSLTVDLYDDGDDGKEKAYVDVLGFGAGGYNFSYTSKSYGWSFFGDTRSFNHDGTLNVWIKSLMGDFMLDKSKLVAWGKSAHAPVPEPSTMLLMGVGLTALVGCCRKRLSKRGQPVNMAL